MELWNQAHTIHSLPLRTSRGDSKSTQRSKSLAFEICNAKQGVYEVEVTNSAMALSAGYHGNAKTENSESLGDLHHIAEKGHVRRYKLFSGIEGKRLSLAAG